MPKYHITPWRYHSELLQVRRELYQLGDSAPPADDRRHAVDWVIAWHMRGNLPHAVESTALLVDAILHHDATKNSLTSIRATYMAAFCRFVTGFCDMKQDEGRKTAMIIVAEELDMPASFVELRHEATHEGFPTLQRFAHNTKLALDWLWQHYWAKLDEEPPANRTTKKTEYVRVAKMAPVDNPLRAVLATFLRARVQEIKASVTDFTATSASGTACLELVKLCKGRTESLQSLTALLLEEKMLIPSGRALNATMTGAFTIWDNLLRRLCVHQKRFPKLLLNNMILTVTQPSHLHVQWDAFRQAVAEWIEHIFTAALWIQSRVKELMEPCRKDVVSGFVMRPNEWSVPLARKLVHGAGDEFKGQWEGVVGVLKVG